MTSDAKPTSDDKTIVSELIPVSWSGKQLFIEKSKLDEWYKQSYEEHDAYAKEHPWSVQGIAIQDFSEEKDMVAIQDFSQDKAKVAAAAAKNVELTNYVVVHWSGKSLLLRRTELDTWFNEGPEDKLEYIRLHPSVEIDFSK